MNTKGIIIHQQFGAIGSGDDDDTAIIRKTACFGSRLVEDSSAFGRLVPYTPAVLLDSSGRLDQSDTELCRRSFWYLRALR
jgi:hypothetical protein